MRASELISVLATPPWPSWLEIPDEPLTETLPQSTTNISREAICQRSATTEELQGQSLESELQASTSIDEIRRVAYHHNFIIAKHKEHSKLAFGRLLTHQASLPILKEFLDDRKLNTPSADNLRTLMTWRELQQQPSHELNALRQWIQSRVAYGNTSETEIRSIVRGANWQCNFGKLLSTSQLFTWSIVKAVWAGIQASTENGIRKLGVKTVACLLEAVSESPLRDEGRNIGNSILFKKRHGLRDLLPSIVNYATRLSQIGSPKHMNDAKEDAQPCSFSWFVNVVQNLPQAEAVEIIKAISSVLTHNPLEKGIKGQNRIQQWFNALTSELYNTTKQETGDWWIVERNLALLDPKILASYLRLLPHRERYLFILRYWIPPRWPRTTMGGRHETTHKLTNAPSWQEFVHDLELRSYYPEGAEDTLVLDVIRRLHQTYPALLKNILSELFRLLGCLDEHKVMVNVVHYLKRKGLSVEYSVLAAQITQRVKLDVPQAYELFKADNRLRLEDCPGLTEGIISTPSVDSIKVFELLKRQPEVLGSVNLGTLPDRPLHTNPKRVRLLHKMALAFAHEPNLNPRQAYRKVERCVQYFRQRPDLLQPDMSKALATAGILRFLEAGMLPSTHRSQYILGFVRGLEGEVVAQELNQIVFEWRKRNAHLATQQDRLEAAKEAEHNNSTS